MIKKTEVPDNLYELPEDERSHMELCFLRDFTVVLEKHRCFIERHHVYKILIELFDYAKKQLEWEENKVA